MADSPEKLPQLVLSKYKTSDESAIAAAIAAQAKSPSRLLTLPFDKITKQAGMADINNASMTKGEKTPLNAMLNSSNPPTTSNTPMAQQQLQSNSDRQQTSDNESNTSGKKALKNVA